MNECKMGNRNKNDKSSLWTMKIEMQIEKEESF